ncbi:hypothetical protein BDV96DRAFT_674566 [Lophiotrema nucula]|uniref:Uncharacterized protein n=1 Tax=Lophiotrema nucula TaxID=690887 RepID=A0A6A5ZLW3_9PLEO|nr:hypothetical protein BDV96DRAFT_674566 [Lophiotrema nucula]
MMGTLKAYFSYKAVITCGIPTATLEGKKLDYELFLKRLDKLCEYGTEPKAFSKLLRPILQGFIDTFDDPESDSVKAFWKQICDYEGGSGMCYYSGWITAFCFWDNEGRRQIKGKRVGVSADSIPSGFTTVPVTINDNGLIVYAKMLAGSVGIISTSTNKDKKGPVGNDSLRPQLGWCMYEKAGQTPPKLHL